MSALFRQTPSAALACALAVACLPLVAHAETQSRFLTTSDGVRLHYLEAGSPDAPPIVFVPGWTMPAWIWDAQIQALSDDFHVLALDPRGQGQSDIPFDGYEPTRRGRDVGELIEQATDRPVLLVGWSLGVLDALSYLRADGDARIAGLVLVDNSIGEGPAPQGSAALDEKRALSIAERTRRRTAFVAGMFARDPGADYRERLTLDALRMPEEAEQSLLSYPVPRTEWRAAVHGTDVPVLYAIRPRWRIQGEALLATRPGAEVAMFETAGHALFVDEADRFNALIRDFATRRVWPEAAS